jgi:ubiquinone biosynthesis protein
VHADLHGGNIFLSDDGRIAVFDWSLAIQVPKRHREAIVAIAIGGLTLDTEKVCRAVAELGRIAADHPELAVVVDEALDREVWRGELPGFEWLVRMLDDVALRTACSFPQDLLLFRKSWLSLAGVIRDIGVDASPDLPLIGVAARRFVEEYAARWIDWPGSRHFATHVSNLDLVNLLASSMLVPVRYWGRVFARTANSA